TAGDLAQHIVREQGKRDAVGREEGAQAHQLLRFGAGLGRLVDGEGEGGEHRRVVVDALERLLQQLAGEGLVGREVDAGAADVSRGVVERQRQVAQRGRQTLRTGTVV